jgi:hypothetical protein
VSRLEIRPQPGPQQTFLSTSADIAVYGGSAGGGKTWSLLFEPLRHVKNPGFGGVVFRRTSPQITNEGGLWDESEQLYPLVGGVGLTSTHDWRFPSGANLGFRHLQYESDKYNWQGAQLAYLGWDELTHFTEGQFFYLLSRCRTTCGVRPYVRAGCNPDAGSWVKRFLAPWVDKTYPDPARSGELRWFVRVKGHLHWSRHPAELIAKFPEEKVRPKSVTFVAASIFDNKILLAKDPDYLANLHALPEVERARLLDGDWDAVREGLVYRDFGTCLTVLGGSLPAGRDVGGIDFGWNHPFAAELGVLDRDDVLWMHWERYQSWCTLPLHAAALPGRAEWYADPARPESIAELRIAGHDVAPCLHMGERPILSGIDQVAERIRTRRLKIVAAECPNLVRELGTYRYDTDKNLELPIDADNHAPDALRYLVTCIDRGRSIPIRRSANVDADQVALERVVRRMEERKRRSAERAEDRAANRPVDDFEDRADELREQQRPDDGEEPWWLRSDDEDD